ncbi:MAG: translation elongation factor Ts [Candidatus Saccharibacteria bacterium]
MAIDIKEVKRLKDLTGVGLTDAKAALEEAGGDFDKALKAMRKKGLTKAEKRSEREARQGIIGSYVHDNRIGVIVEVNCETDFVARNEIFTSFVKDIAMHIAASNPEFVDQSQISDAEKKRIEKELTEKAESEGKPKDMLDKIVSGQVSKYFEERCLVDQPYIKNPDISVGEYIKETNARLGENIVVRRFSRLALGEVS